MNFNLALSLLVPALVGGTVVALSAEDLTSIHNHAMEKAAEVQARNDAQTLEAARLMLELGGGKPNASAEELVAAGLLKESFLSRERVTPQSPVPTSE